MFHVELRRFPHVAREFNLNRAELDSRIVVPWTAGQVVESGERRWAPERARLTIYEGRELRPDEIGMGRGWANVTRNGQDVTSQILDQAGRSSPREADLARVKEKLLERCNDGAFEIRSSVEIATELHPELRASDRLALVEQAIWELLHSRSVTVSLQGKPLEPEQWQDALLSWATWSGQGGPAPMIEPAAGLSR